MHVIRARGNNSSKEVALRKFYAGPRADYELLKNLALTEDLLLLATFWTYVNTRKKPSDDDGYTISEETRQYFHCLSLYPNDYWKYPVSVFFLKQRNSQTFDAELCLLLKGLLTMLFVKFIDSPSVNTIRDKIYDFYISIQNGAQNINMGIDVELNNPGLFNRKLTTEFGSPKISRALILLYAYLDINQTELIPTTFDIEHIFPRRWQVANFNGWNLAAAQQCLESFGNKTVLERKLNIQAGNNYFNEKKQRYAQSQIACVVALSQLPQTDWTQTDIKDREQLFVNTLLGFFNQNR
jgi:hypothetical protein